MNDIIQWRRAGKAYLTEVDHVTVAVSVHPAGGWQWCTNRDNGPSGYDPGLADAKEHAVQFTRLWLSERQLEVSLQALKEENAMLRDAVREERTAVVAWLREQAETGDPMRATGRRRMADAIERGEHRREEKP